MIVDSAFTALLGRLFDMLSVKNNLCKSYLTRIFCSLKSLPLVVNIIAVA